MTRYNCNFKHTSWAICSLRFTVLWSACCSLVSKIATCFTLSLTASDRSASAACTTKIL